MRFYKSIVIFTGTIDYYANRLYNNIVVSQRDEKVFRPADSVFKLSGKGLCRLAQQRKAGLYYPADKADRFLLTVLVIALHDHMHQPV